MDKKQLTPTRQTDVSTSPLCGNLEDAGYLPAAIRESKYRKEFTFALSQCVDLVNYKYALYTQL